MKTIRLDTIPKGNNERGPSVSDFDSVIFEIDTRHNGLWVATRDGVFSQALITPDAAWKLFVFLRDNLVPPQAEVITPGKPASFK